MAATVEQFWADITTLALKLVQAYGLTYSLSGSTADEMALQRWMDYRLRHVIAQPRKVVKSSRFPVQNVPAEINKALSVLEAKFTNGDDVNPYLSKTTIANDVSAAKQMRRTDGLWADWGIHHLHLTPEPLLEGERFSKRSGWLLFARIYEDVVALIDVRSHDEKDLWTQEELLKTFIDSWPEQAEPHRISTMQVTSAPTEPGDVKSLRNAGIVAPVEHNGQHYFGFGGGVTAAVTSSAASMACVNVIRNAHQLALWLDSPDNKIRVELNGLGISQPKFFLGVGDHGLVIAERTKTEHAWNFPESNQRNFIAVQDGLLPAWAVPTLMDHLRSEL
ncbi:hypothetical protein GTP58_27540 [Duganella sp. CY15W]|uniref:hypothetical protein n=1 Tax=Duganella sp. CY15W TaxID=2692172 RepID=UPI0013709EE8|nr:hypothetical protein [Duganella sp. CY15W]MYM32091.1 hypothetical protein [Duganella sp. CY15W]